MKSKKEIAVVEDNELYLNLVQKRLENSGYEVDIFFNAEALVSEIKDGYTPDIVVTDYDLSGPFQDKTFMNGIDLIKLMRDFGMDTETIVLSAHDNVEISDRAIRNGAYDYVVKNDTVMTNLVNRVSNLSKKIDQDRELKSLNKTKLIIILVAIASITFALLAS